MCIRPELHQNVAKLAEPPRAEKDPVRPLTPEEARAFLEHVRGERLEALWTVALAVGLRRGEALGLRRQDVDLEAGELRVVKNLQRLTGHGLVLTEPKSRESRRTIPLPPLAVTALHDHRRRMTAERLKAGPEWTESELIFVATTGLPLDPSNVSHMGRRHLKKAGRPDLTLHGLRHSCASLLLAQGIEPLLIKEILGHSQVSFTLSI